MTIFAILLLASSVRAAQPVPPGYSSLSALDGVRPVVLEIPWASREGNDEGSQEQCAQVMKKLDFISDLDPLYTCSAFYWHNGEFDNPPGSYNNMIKINYRVLVLDPTDADTYSTTAWLLWSKWVTWTKDPQAMPDGESKKDESISIFEKGIRYNRYNALFYNEYANHMFGFIGDFDKAIELYKLTNEFALQDKLRVQARLSVARCYRHIGQIESAKEWYKAVLEIDPQNQNALKSLRELEGGEGTSSVNLNPAVESGFYR